MEKYALIVCGHNEMHQFIDLRVAGLFNTRKEAEEYMELATEKFKEDGMLEIENSLTDYGFYNPLNEREVYLINIQPLEI